MVLPASIGRQRGFTLAELLVAIAVIALVMGGLLALLTGGQFGFVEGSNMVDAQQSARIALARMVQEIRGGGYNPSGDPALFPAITAQSATGFTIQNDWNGNGVIETNVTVTTVGGISRGEQVTYSVSGNLLRRQESNIDGSPLTIAPVESVTFQYLDATDVVTATAANIRTIVVTVTMRPQVQAATALQGKAVVGFSDRVRLRNR